MFRALYICAEKLSITFSSPENYPNVSHLISQWALLVLLSTGQHLSVCIRSVVFFKVCIFRFEDANQYADRCEAVDVEAMTDELFLRFLQKHIGHRSLIVKGPMFTWLLGNTFLCVLFYPLRYSCAIKYSLAFP